MHWPPILSSVARKTKQVTMLPSTWEARSDRPKAHIVGSVPSRSTRATTPPPPLFIYSAPVIDSIHPHTGESPPDQSEWVPALGRLAQLIDDISPTPRPMLPYTTFFFNHELCFSPEAPDVVREFEYDMAFSLAPETTITYRGTVYYPTAWILRLGRLVPFEFLRESVGTIKNLAQCRRLFHKMVLEMAEFNHRGNIILRLKDGTWKAGQYRRGGFGLHDSEIALRFLHGSRHPFTWAAYTDHLVKTHNSLPSCTTPIQS
jgi:hypothetical protein